jgi:diguanylate cyclase (GGDEF)-like protein
MPTPAPEDLDQSIAKLTRRLERERKARREAEAIAERGLRELYVKQREIELLERIAAAANGTASIRDTLHFAIKTVCEYTGWTLGHAYLTQTDAAGPRLASTTIWHEADGHHLDEFQRLSETTSFRPGAGLPGRALATGAPAWIADIRHDGNFPRADSAQHAGIKAGFAFPVLAGNEVVAVLEFFTDKVPEPGAVVLALMAQIGTQLGRVVERARAEEKLVHDASHDPLTGLPNRALLLDRLKQALARNHRRRDYNFAVLFIDLDRFKLVNDSLGHGAGDRLIVEVGARLIASLRATDGIARSPRGAGDSHTVARLGGDEFTVILDDIRDVSAAVVVADRINERLVAPFSIDGQELYVSASIGIVSSASGYGSESDILRDADLAMYQAKALGKARCQVYDPSMHASALKRLALESNLRRAVQNDEFILHYQPIVALGSEQIVGFEALLRWQPPDGELVYPGDFIQIAEDTGLIEPIGMWVLHTACSTMRRWQTQFPQDPPLTIAVNLSVRQFAQPDLLERVGETIREIGIDPQTVRLEITESVAMVDAERTMQIFTQLRDIGVRLSIDDFGTGYSSLSYLHRYPVDILKIDRSFVSRINDGYDGLQIVQAIMSLARSLGMQVVAEGTETEAHIACLKAIGCQFAQGYHFSRPVDAASAQALLEGPAEGGAVAARA